MLDVVVGFDAGGTSTKCALMTLDGQLIAQGTAGPGNYQLIKAEGVRKVLSEAYAAARATIGEDVRVHAAFLGIAGATTPSESQLILEVCESLGIAPMWRVMGDMVPALAAGTKGSPGIVIIGGTGSICWGCDVSGAVARAGGWGYLFSDEGSGYYIGQRALAAAFRAFDGRGPKTSLNNRILRTLACPDMPEVVSHIYALDEPRTAIAALAPVVLEAAADGDDVANTILVKAAQLHVTAILAVYRRLQFDSEVTVVASGGLFQHTDALYQRVRLALAPLLPGATVLVPEVEPVVGACYLALRMVQGDAWPQTDQ